MLYLYELSFLLVGLMTVWGSFSIYSKVRGYFRKEKRLSEVEDQYERLRNSRRDFLVFYLITKDISPF